MEFEQIITLIKTVSDSKVTSFTYEKDDTKISIKTGDGNKKQEVCVVPSMPVQAAVQQPVQMTLGAVQNTAAVQAEPVQQSEDEGVMVVTSPLVGTFYSAASPDDEPFVKVGDRVTKGQKLGIIEAMKLMNDIESDYDGEIIEIMVSNEGMVEYGQPLFRIK